MPGFGNLKEVLVLQSIMTGLGMKAAAALIWVDGKQRKADANIAGFLHPQPPFYSVWDPGLRDDVVHIQGWIYSLA